MGIDSGQRERERERELGPERERKHERRRLHHLLFPFISTRKNLIERTIPAVSRLVLGRPVLAAAFLRGQVRSCLGRCTIEIVP